MANELAVSVSLRFVKGTLEKAFNSGQVKVDVAGAKPTDHVQSIGITEEAIVLNEAAVGGYMILHNLDATNFIEIRPNTAIADLIKLLPGEVAMFRTASDAVPYAIADTAAANLRIIIIPV